MKRELSYLERIILIAVLFIIVFISNDLFENYLLSEGDTNPIFILTVISFHLIVLTCAGVVLFKSFYYFIQGSMGPLLHASLLVLYLVFINVRLGINVGASMTLNPIETTLSIFVISLITCIGLQITLIDKKEEWFIVILSALYYIFVYIYINYIYYEVFARNI